VNFSTIRIEGGLLPAELLEQVALGEAKGQRPEDFGLEKNRRLTDEIAAAWSDARAHWDSLQRTLRRLPEDDPATTPTREQWVKPLLRSLGYPELATMRTAAVVEGQTFFVSHRAGESDEALPVHIVGIRSKLDERPPSGRPRLSPHALVQEYLNRTEHVWSLVTNGSRLRLLRDSSRMTRPSYVEFDLEGMLAGEKFAEFGVFYRLLHRTRMPQGADDASQCLLEAYYHEGIEQGGRVREKLREGVDEALKLLGNGFLVHPANEKLRERLRSGELSADDYYRQLLRLVYRLLFLMVAEERGLVVSGTANASTSVYGKHYSVSRLRGLAEQSLTGTQRHGDLWLGLLATFRLFEEDGAGTDLGVSALDGDLFGPNAVPDLTGTHLTNGIVLAAMGKLSRYKEKGIQRRVNYAALDVEELGSVYESLLDYRPVIRSDESSALPVFDLVTGSERKTTGSYYTRPELVQELIKSALEPVLEERLHAAGATAEKVRALLSLKVCDPACGSGHFLLAAARRIGKELARVRSGEAEPTPTDFRRGVRDAIRHCIYGVDVNPLAVDLCKVALWMEAHVAGEPLTFLDHRVRLGNSLIGGFPVQVSDRSERTRDLPPNVPDEAFDPVTGDDKKVASAVKKRNKAERTGQITMLLSGGELEVQKALAPRKWDEYARLLCELGEMSDATVAGVRAKQKQMENLRRTPEYHARKFALDLWTAAFFWPLDDPTAWVPTDGIYRGWVEHGLPVPDSGKRQVRKLAEENRFFHWSLEFPDVFNPHAGGAGGFDVVLGNPPWERIKLQEEEHWIDEPYISKASNKAERSRRIEEYRGNTDPFKRLRTARFDAAKHAAEAWSKFVRASGRWPLTAVGDVNTYALFAEVFTQALSPTGRMGVVLPTGIATDDTTKAFFGDLVKRQVLVRLIGYENEAFIFPSVHHSFKFCTLTVAGHARKTERADFAFLCRHFEDAESPARRFELTPRDLTTLNPNTRTCPVFRTRADAELARSLYERVPVLVNERERRDPWGIRFLTMFHMANDSGTFSASPALDMVPLYEAKMMHQFDHRYGTYEGATQAQLNVGTLPQPSTTEKQNPQYKVTPKYWVPKQAVEERLEQWNKEHTELIWRWDHEWLLGFRDVTSSVVERTAIFSLLPRVGAGHKIPLVFLDSASSTAYVACFLANANSLAFDYTVRQKVGGLSLSYFILKQLPVLAPSAYSRDDLDFIVPRVLALVYSTADLTPFARDLGYHGDPFIWNEEWRRRLRAQLDAYYFKLYGLTRKQARYVLDPYDLTDRELTSILEVPPDDEYADKVSKTRDFPGETFRVLKQSEIRKHGLEDGRWRLQRTVLGYDQAIRAGDWGVFEEPDLPKLSFRPEPQSKKRLEVVPEGREKSVRRTGTGG
jgi:hypothetical protein